jgi:hypothetical protein
MQTNGDFVARVIGSLKALTKDGRISRRLVLFTGWNKARFLISQKLDEMTMFREEGLITTIPCVLMEPISVKSCDIFEFKLCHSLMRSVKPLPEGIFGKNGNSIISVTNVDGSEYYSYIDPKRFALLSKRKYVIKDTRFFYVRDGYLYLPNSTTELVDITMITTDMVEASQMSDCDCQEKEDNKCKSVWDAPFVCPDRFYDLVVKDTLNELASVWRTSVSDEKPNLNSNER